MAKSPESAVVEVPARIANLAFRLEAPRDWSLHELPPEEVDFSTPTNFFPLALLTAPWALVALTIAARPGFEDGTLQDWVLYLLSGLGIQPTAFAPAKIGNVAGLAGVGRQHQEGTWLEVRFAFFEDGGRLVYIGLLAPEEIGSSLEPVWNQALESFTLGEPQGPTVETGPGVGIMPERRTVPEPVAPPSETVVADADETAVEVPEEARGFQEPELGFYAKSADAGTLDPEHPTNANLRDRGVGFVPNVLDVNLEARTAKLGAGAIEACIQVALGWHVNDDGKRTLLLDPDGKIQISLHLIDARNRGAEQILDAIQAEAEASHANPEFLRMEQDGLRGLAVRNISVNDEEIEQVHLLTRWREDSAMLRARVTSDPASVRYAVNYAELVLRSADYGRSAAEGTR